MVKKKVAKGKDIKDDTKTLRELAEAKILKSEIEQKDLSKDEIKEILQELQTHQIELEMQNEELKLSQLELEESREKFSSLYNFAPVGYFTLNAKGVITLSNLTAANLLGFTKTELLNKPFTNYIYKEDQDNYYLNRKRLMETKVKQQFETRIKNSDGTYFWANVDSVLSENETDGIFNMITITDITKNKNNEDRLRENEIHLKETQIIAHIGNYSMDIVNDKWTSSEILDDIFGIDSDYDKSTKGWASIIHPDWQETMYNYFKQEVVGKGIGFDKEYKIVRQKDNAERWVHGKGELKFNENYQPVLMIGTIQDITEQKRIEEALKLKNEQLEKINSEKDKFFSIIAHDLRSPFNVFLGYTEVLKEDIHSMSLKELQNIANSMNRSANNLFELLTNLLEWAMMKRGLTAFKPDKISLKLILELIFDIFKETAKKKAIEVEIDIADNVFVMADKSMINTILRNFVSNAIKFTKRGGRVTISAIKLENSAVITVKDTGIGIPEEMINDLFKLDRNTRRIGTDNERSTGLGLLLCKEFIDKHKGMIWIVSEEGKGSEFVFSLPLF